MQSFNNLELSLNDGILVLTINRLKSLNALNREVLSEVLQVVEQIEEKVIDARVLIITGAGEKAFIAGADIKEMRSLTALESREFSKFGNEVMERIQTLSIPTIAAINGYALGGGLELAMACDIRFACENAVLGLPEVGLGVIPGFGGTQRLPRLVGLAKAKELMFSATTIKAEEGVAIGLVNRVCAKEALMSEVIEFAKRIIKQAPLAVRFAKVAANKGIEMSLDDALGYESELFGLLFSSEDQTEGMNAFIEKRKAEFKNQ